ncbi:MAG: hypothetical protein A3I17_05330 [Candidatus Rokubacteria bacterium RIFCSPLOWO2_02_FULL_72_37]|nr:MAG: hypothetical protein A3I17_05330 [Candidatus Rokubacteria bacterium RIFCSPLOWO2_02_FULL_72_37]
MTADPVVALTGVSARYGGVEVLRLPALDVRAREILAVIGPNGSGKSTLLRLLAFLERPAAGEIRFHGRPVDAAHALAERRRIAMVFQQPLLADATVGENVALGLRFRGAPVAESEARVAHWLRRFNIAPLRDQRARGLSGGEAQRVALARALVLDPELLLLDEPFASLDQPTRETLIPDLAMILRERRVTTVLVTHDRSEAQAFADRVAVLIGGRVRQLDDTARVFQAPASEEVARFVGVETIATGRVLASDAGVTLVEIAGVPLEVAGRARPGELVRVGIRPEDVTLMPPAGRRAVSSARNRLTGTITSMTPKAPGTRVVVAVGFPLVATVTLRSVSELGLVQGATVTAVFKASAAHLIGPGLSLDTGARPGL